jgi:hypothetical protein
MKTLRKTYADIRSAIAFIMRNERGLSRHAVTEAALAATKALLNFKQQQEGETHAKHETTRKR